MKKLIAIALFVASLLIASVSQAIISPTSAFTYQGRLNSGTNPANGSYDLTFALFNVSSGAGQVGSTLTNTAVSVTNGLFTVLIDFGGIASFPGADRWLEIGVRTNGGGAFTTLAPRQALTPTPYAITAGNLWGNLPASQLTGTLPSGVLSGTYSGSLTLNNAGNSFSGNGSGLTSVNAAFLGGLASSNFWQTSGNAGTTPGANFLGTTDNQPLELKVFGQRALRLEPNANGPNVIGGWSGNFVTPGIYGATVAGGGYAGGSSSNIISAHFGTIGGGVGNTIGTNGSQSTISGGYLNLVNSLNGSVGGGFNNSIDPNSTETTIGGGYGNRIQRNATYSIIGGGYQNTIQTNANASTIGGGEANTIQFGSSDATIAGGHFNNIGGSLNSTIGGGNNNAVGSGHASTIGGGENNLVGGDTYVGTIAGGSGNALETTCDYSTIGGGFGNRIGSSFLGSIPYYAVIGGGASNTNLGQSSVIPGGSYNFVSGNNSFAAGYYASAAHNGTFVWADSSTNKYFSSTTNNQFLIRATGGVGIGLTNPAAALHVVKGGLSGQSDTYGGGPAILADSSTGDGVYAASSASSGYGLWGVGSGSGGVGVYGQASSATAIGVEAQGNSTTGTALAVNTGSIRVIGAGLGTSTAAFIHRATTNISVNLTIISNPLCDGDPNAILIVTPNFNPSSVYNNHPIGVYYSAGHWGIFNQDSVAMATNSAFNVLIIKP